VRCWTSSRSFFWFPPGGAPRFQQELGACVAASQLDGACSCAAGDYFALLAEIPGDHAGIFTHQHAPRPASPLSRPWPLVQPCSAWAGIDATLMAEVVLRSSRGRPGIEPPAAICLRSLYQHAPGAGARPLVLTTIPPWARYGRLGRYLDTTLRQFGRRSHRHALCLRPW